MKIRGSELVVRALRDEGARFAFGIPGTHNIELYDALEDEEGVEPVLVTDERGAAFMADGLARSTGSVGVLNVVPGAGVTHALSGIAEAYMDNVPMVVLACGIREDTGAAYQLHAIDQLALLAPVTKKALRIEAADDIYPTIRRAFALARSGSPGPVAVEIPANLMMVTQEASEPVYEPETPGRVDPDMERVRHAAELLAKATQPALYVGAGATAAAEPLVRLAERLEAPVATTIQGKGVFPEDHPLWLWNGFGEQAPRFVRKIMSRCDRLLAVGCRFSEVATGSYGIEPRGLIHVDIDPDVFDKNFPAEVAVESDAKAFVEAVLSLLGDPRARGPIRQEIAAGHREVLEKWESDRSRDRVTPALFFKALQRHCREGAVYTTDSGNGTFLAMEHLRLTAPRRFLAPVDFSCMGYSVPAAVGAAFANPDRDVVALAGDGALLMTGLEALTGGAYGAAPLICVLRDGKLGQIAQFQKIPFNRETCSVLPDYDVQGIAKATGCRFFRVERDDALDSVLPEALSVVRGKTPVMVEVRIDDSRKTYFTRGVVNTNFWRFPWSERLRVLARALSRRFSG